MRGSVGFGRSKRPMVLFAVFFHGGPQYRVEAYGLPIVNQACNWVSVAHWVLYLTTWPCTRQPVIIIVTRSC